MKTKILKALKWTAGGVLLFFIVLVASWNFIPDEPLNPEAANFIAIATPPAPDRNAFYSVYGFTASPEFDQHEVGRAIIAAHDRVLASEKTLRNFKVDSFLGPNKLTVQGQRHCQPEKDNCLATYEKKREEIAQEAERLSIFVARYKKLRSYPDYAFALSQASYETPIPSWQALLRTSDIVDASIATRMGSTATRREALQELAEEIALWRKLLQSNDWLVTQMVAAATLKRKYQLASEIMNRYPSVATDFPTELKLVTAPLDPRQTTVATSIVGEARTNIETFQLMGTMREYFTNSFFDGLPGPPLLVSFYLGGYKPNASTNRSYTAFKKVVEHLSKSPSQMLATQAEHDRDMADLLRFDLRALFYNPVGRLSLGATQPNFVEYANRVQNTLGLSRLVDLQRQILAKNVSAGAMPTFLSDAGPGLMDPYTELPMKWDPTNKRISFESHNRRFDNDGYVTLETVK